MRRLFLALAVGVLGSTSNATANFMFDSVTNGPGGGFSFNYDWTGATVGLPRYGTYPPSGDFIGQVMDGI
jgi:hypothetical protein